MTNSLGINFNYKAEAAVSHFIGDDKAMNDKLQKRMNKTKELSVLLINLVALC